MIFSGLLGGMTIPPLLGISNHVTAGLALSLTTLALIGLALFGIRHAPEAGRCLFVQYSIIIPSSGADRHSRVQATHLLTTCRHLRPRSPAPQLSCAC